MLLPLSQDSGLDRARREAHEFENEKLAPFAARKKIAANDPA
jgi:hypothetical protein